jgi:hypothetical protein
MNTLLTILLRVAGAGLIGLALLHLPLARRLAWRDEAARMSPLNAAVFHVHTFFICFVLVATGLPALIEPAVFLERSRAALWGTVSLCLFWTIRLVFQWTVYSPSWWKGLAFEAAMHRLFTVVWLFLVLLFGACAAVQLGWL